MTDDRRNTEATTGGDPRLRDADVSSLLLSRPRRRLLAHTARKLLAGPLYLATHALRRDPRLWLFGSFKGYRDSPRYLAEHLVEAGHDLTACWIARTDEEAQQARAAGLRVALWGSPAADAAHRRAAVAFISNSFRDLDVPSLGGAFLVHLHHGTPLKRIGLDVDWRSFAGRSALVRTLVRLNRAPARLQFRMVDMYVAAGELAQRRYMTAFAASAERVPAIGTPRFDVIRGGAAYERVAGANLRARLGYGDHDRIVVWLPTWREHGDAGWLPPLDGGELEAALGDTAVRLLVKTHPFADWDVYTERLPTNPRVRLLREEEVDVNCLLHIADALVTDYSSAAFDFAILERPIHFFAPDVDEYAAGRNLYEPYEKLTGGLHHRDWASLLASLAAGARDGAESEGHTLARRVADYTRNNTEPEVSRRLTEAILAATAH